MLIVFVFACMKSSESDYTTRCYDVIGCEAIKCYANDAEVCASFFNMFKFILL